MSSNYFENPMINFNHLSEIQEQSIEASIVLINMPKKQEEGIRKGFAKSPTENSSIIGVKPDVIKRQSDMILFGGDGDLNAQGEEEQSEYFSS